MTQVLYNPYASPSGNESYSRAKSLWAKVFIRAAFDVASYRDSPRPQDQRVARSGEAFLFNPYSDFKAICSLFDLPAEKIQEWARALTKEDVSRMEYTDRSPDQPPEVQVGDEDG